MVIGFSLGIGMPVTLMLSRRSCSQAASRAASKPAICDVWSLFQAWRTLGFRLAVGIRSYRQRVLSLSEFQLLSKDHGRLYCIAVLHSGSFDNRTDICSLVDMDCSGFSISNDLHAKVVI